MRSSSKAFSLPIALVQLAGWLTVGILFWLLLFTHNAVAAPQSEGGHTVAAVNSVERLRARRHAAFWQARERIRATQLGHHSLFDRMLHGSRHTRTERARVGHRQPGHKLTRKPVLGPALGAIFQRQQR